MKTLFIGSYGFGNLGDELCLIEAIKSFPSKEIWVRTIFPEHTSKMIACNGFIKWSPFRPQNNYKIDFERVVYGGGFLYKDLVYWIMAAQNSGAQTYIHNVGIKNNLFSWADEKIKESFKKLDGISVRDSYSKEILLSLGIKKEIKITSFPEKEIEKDLSLANSLPNNCSILGITIDNGGHIFSNILLNPNKKRIKKRINTIIEELPKPVKILPVISKVHIFSDCENDIKYFYKFYDQFLRGFEIVLPEILNKKWWFNHLTPQKLKGLISKCKVLISTSKHNCLHALSCGIKTIGICFEETKKYMEGFFHPFNDSLENNKNEIFLVYGKHKKQCKDNFFKVILFKINKIWIK